MKIRNLLLGSVAIAGLSTGGAYAADLGVLTSLDVCDSLGLSGLTISSDTNCLQISGSVEYDFTWGDYRLDAFSNSPDESIRGTNYVGADYGSNNWESKVDAWLKFVGTASSDFGKAKAVIKLESVEQTLASASGTYTSVYTSTGDDDTSGNVYIDEAYVSIGDSTIITAGKADSIFNDGDDVDLGWLQLFNSADVDDGVGDSTSIDTGGHVIQLTTQFGDGFSGGVALENLASADYQGGTLVGVVAYAGDGISAHASFKADGILNGNIDEWATHAGFAGTFDNFKVVVAGAFDSNDYWNVLASASATFDMFEIAGSVEAAEDDYTGAAGSISATVSDGIKLNVGGRWADDNGTDGYEIAAGIVADVTETLKLTGQVGYADNSVDDVFYGSLEAAWAPGGGYTSSVKGTLSSDGGYKIESTFKKTFQ